MAKILRQTSTGRFLQLSEMTTPILQGVMKEIITSENDDNDAGFR